MLWQQGWDSAPPLVQHCARSWEERNPGWVLHRLDEATISDFAPEWADYRSDKASRQAGVTGENLLRMLECRFDNVLVRLGFAASRRQARQLILHGHWTVNGRRVNIPSYQLRDDDVIAIHTRSSAQQVIRDATELTGQVPAWLQADHDSLTAKVLRKPERREIAAPVQEQLIVELYSK